MLSRFRPSTRLRTLVASASLLVAPVSAAADAVPPACTDATGQAGFTQSKRRCYEELVARGRYQEVLDRVEAEPLAISAQEQFFLGASYFGLANRTAAQSLRCIFSLRAKELLEAFLVERQSLFRNEGSFGTSDDMLYVHRATKTLAALKSITGCEESGYTTAGLERFGRGYATERVRGLFYGSDTDALQKRFAAKLATLETTMQGFVGTASQVESRTGLTISEIEAARSYLLAVQATINGQFAVTESATDDHFPSFAWEPTVKRDVLVDLDARGSALAQLVGDTGEIGSVRKKVLAIVDETSMDDYAKHKEETILRILGLTAELVLPINFGTEMARPSRGWKGALDDALAKPVANELGRAATALDTVWSDGMRSKFCTSNPTRWYCKGGTP
jgi:hypothetical protein